MRIRLAENKWDKERRHDPDQWTLNYTEITKCIIICSHSTHSIEICQRGKSSCIKLHFKDSSNVTRKRRDFQIPPNRRRSFTISKRKVPLIQSLSRHLFNAILKNSLLFSQIWDFWILLGVIIILSDIYWVLVIVCQLLSFTCFSLFKFPVLIVSKFLLLSHFINVVGEA